MKGGQIQISRLKKYSLNENRVKGPTFTNIQPTEGGDKFLCSMSNGQIKVLQTSSFLDESAPKYYSFDLSSQCQSTAQIISFSPFYQDAFLASWDGGAFALFHTNESYPSLKWESWNHTVPLDTSSHQRHQNYDTNEDIRSIVWSKTQPCVFFVLTNISVAIFDLKRSKYPWKVEAISKIQEKSSSHSVVSLIRGYAKTSPPRLVLKNKKGPYFVSLLDINSSPSENVNNCLKDDLDYLRCILRDSKVVTKIK
jgi:hypothetical protein